MKVTRTIFADAPPALASICSATGFLRADIWRRFGALGMNGKSALDIRLAITDGGFYAVLAVDGTIRNETTKDAINDIVLYKAAAKERVRRAIAGRTQDQAERKRLYGLLKADLWLQDNFLHRAMRKHFRHGVSHTSNQFIVRSDRHTEETANGMLVVTIKIARKYGADIKLTTTTSGKNVVLKGCNLRIIVKDDRTEIHYATDKGEGRLHGEQALGIDKGYTEAFVDSDGDQHGEGFGKVLTDFSDKAAHTGIARNRLYALEKKHRANGNIAKADRIAANNLGRVKIDTRRTDTQRQLRGIAFKAAHSIVDKAALVVSEDLTSPIASKQQWRGFNRRMGMWAKGSLADALDSVCKQREAEHAQVNAAYTSQIDSETGLLTGKRTGDKFVRENGDVVQADTNAARNVLARISDPQITRYMPYTEVRGILLSRSPAVTGRQVA